MMKRCLLSPVQNSLDFLWIYSNTFSRDNKTKKFCFLNMKLVFINVGLQFGLLQVLQNLANMRIIFFWRLNINKNIVKVYLYKTM